MVQSKWKVLKSRSACLALLKICGSFRRKIVWRGIFSKHLRDLKNFSSRKRLKTLGHQGMEIKFSKSQLKKGHELTNKFAILRSRNQISRISCPMHGVYFCQVPTQCPSSSHLYASKRIHIDTNLNIFIKIETISSKTFRTVVHGWSETKLNDTEVMTANSEIMSHQSLTWNFSHISKIS